MVPFDLSTRAASQVYIDVLAPLQDEWDVNVATFPSSIVSLKMRAAEGKWNQAVPHGILTINGRNVLTDYHSVMDAEITTAYANRTYTCAIQNSTAIFKCIKLSIMRSIRDTIFTQAGNHPTNTDVIALFNKKLTNFRTVAVLQLSLLSFNSIIALNPLEIDFNISLINTKLM